jgi:2-phospho-L-lactate guanylyltransferase
MRVWAAIPVKPLEHGKSRLQEALSPTTRARLNARLLGRVMAAVVAVVAPENIIVVSRDAAVQAEVLRRGMRMIPERGETLNAALTEALELPGPEDALLAISADLPELTPEDVGCMVEATTAARAVVIAPDRQREGTNALLTIPAGCIPFRFGKASFAAHVSAARNTGLEPVIVTRPGLAFDLDLPEDLPLCPRDLLS